MSHFAKVKDGIVTEVIVVEQNVIENGEFGDPSQWIQTSYNTRGGVHFDANKQPDGGIPIRKNFAAIGYTYDPVLDAFYEPQPFPSWKLNTETCLWEPPVPCPPQRQGWQTVWNEQIQDWMELLEDTDLWTYIGN